MQTQLFWVAWGCDFYIPKVYQSRMGQTFIFLLLKMATELKYDANTNLPFFTFITQSYIVLIQASIRHLLTEYMKNTSKCIKHISKMCIFIDELMSLRTFVTCSHEMIDKSCHKFRDSAWKQWWGSIWVKLRFLHYVVVHSFLHLIFTPYTCSFLLYSTHKCFKFCKWSTYWSIDTEKWLRNGPFSPKVCFL